MCPRRGGFAGTVDICLSTSERWLYVNESSAIIAKFSGPQGNHGRLASPKTQ